jgi:hypothetical protein
MLPTRLMPTLKTAFGVLLVIALVGLLVAAHHDQNDTVHAKSMHFVSPPPEKSVVWAGDSYTVGYGSTDPIYDYVDIVCGKLRWACNADAEGGTGFTANGHQHGGPKSFKPAIGRLGTDHSSLLADSFIIDFGRNDGPLTPAISKAAAQYVSRVHQLWPHAKLVMIAPFFITGQEVPGGWGPMEKALMKRHGGIAIDPQGEGWLNDPSMQKHTFPKVGGNHPDDVGYAYLGKRFTATFEHYGLASPANALP